MTATRTKIFVIGLVTFAVIAIATRVIVGRQPLISLTVLSYKTNRVSDDLVPELGSRSYVCAVIAVTNNSQHAVTYMGMGSPELPEYDILHWSRFAWRKPTGGWRCGTGMEAITLSPSHGFTFEAVVDTDAPCKVRLEYCDSSNRKQIWQRLPYWLSSRMPWTSPWRTVVTKVVDLTATR
jgi:hypothetical protein